MVKAHFSSNGELVMESPGRFTQEFKLAVVRRHGVWSEPECAAPMAPGVPPGSGQRVSGQQRWSEGRVAELERKASQQVLEVDFLKGCLQCITAVRMTNYPSIPPAASSTDP
jgi:hypothetical protein